MTMPGLHDSLAMLISLLARIACALVLLGASPTIIAKPIDHLGANTVSAPAGITVLVLTAPATITLTATASDTDGTINRVEFYAGASLIGTSTTPPYSVTWTPLASGPHTLTAQAFDNLETNTVSAPVNVTVTGAITYLHNDFSGNPIAATDANGAILWKENFRPYGDRLNNPPAASTNRQWFHGKAVDQDTGLSYFGARYYDPTLGRFMGVDSERFSEENLHSFNRYAYGNNNPYKFADPDGNNPRVLLLVAEGSYYVATRLGAGLLGSMVGVALWDAKQAILNANSANSGDGGKTKNGNTGEPSVKPGADEGCIYCVKGDKTKSGKDYIGSSDNIGEREKDKSDGRDRKGAEIVDTYPKGESGERRRKEQQHMNDRGGKDALDNRRNEVAPRKWPEMGIRPPSQ